MGTPKGREIHTMKALKGLRKQNEGRGGRTSWGVDLLRGKDVNTVLSRDSGSKKRKVKRKTNEGGIEHWERPRRVPSHKQGMGKETKKKERPPIRLPKEKKGDKEKRRHLRGAYREWKINQL